MRALACACLVVAACNGDRYGAYLHVTAPQDMQQIEFVFGGYMPSPACDGTTIPDAPVLRRTPMFDNRTPSPNDTMFRRQPSPGDVRAVSGTDYTLYVNTPVNDPKTPFDDALGHTLIVVAHTASGGLLAGELDDFTVSTTEVDTYEITLAPVDPSDLEQWGGGDERCLRYTRSVPGGGMASEFIVPTWDRDCDGFFTQLCYGTPIDDDCDPLAFCDTSVSGDLACEVPEGCVATSTNGGVCSLSTCVNDASSETKICGGAGEFCLANKCDIADCDRAPLDCLAVRASPDVTCDVPAMKLHDTDIGVVCPGVSGLLHMGPPDMTCNIIAQASLDPTRTLGVGFDTSSSATGCELSVVDLSANAVLPETRLLVEVRSSVGAQGILVIDARPMFGSECDNPPDISCQPVTAMPETCNL